MYDKYTYKVKA